MTSANDNTREYCAKCNKPLLFPDKPCPYCSNSEKEVSDCCCAKCGTALKNGFLFSNLRKISKLDELILNLDSQKTYCDKCYNSINKESIEKLAILSKKFTKILEEMPVITIEKPVNLSLIKYCQVVTSQIIVDSGDLSEFIKAKEGRSFFDNDFSKKLSLAENTCLANLKKNALKSSANMIVGCNIEYSQLNYSNNVFLIAMLGTGIVVEEFNVLTEYEQKIFNHYVTENS